MSRWIASCLLHGGTESQVETCGSALLSYHFNGCQNPSDVHLAAVFGVAVGTVLLWKV